MFQMLIKPIQELSDRDHKNKERLSQKYAAASFYSGT